MVRRLLCQSHTITYAWFETIFTDNVTLHTLKLFEVWLMKMFRTNLLAHRALPEGLRVRCAART